MTKKQRMLIFICSCLILTFACQKHEHIWTEATCTSPKTCSVCGKTEGVALNHEFLEWSLVRQATCSQQGIEKRKCARCGIEEERYIAKTAHVFYKWETIKEATVDEDGRKAKICKVCGERYDRETITLSGEERLEWLKKHSKSISYRELLRNPNTYVGEYLKCECFILQVVSEATSSKDYSVYRAATSGKYDDVILLYVSNYGSSRIIEEDKLTVYGRFDGIISYKTVLGTTVTVPKVISKYRIRRS